ncbi:hypothetical protein OVA11_13290 [Caulobacter sp. SL161]|uniref:hypothetical protein n=1 Tax=Caulobacter sp. SL161 TaxID=2995156 RepID=UPI0022739C36|nr:hypothetical protein [Caulobacter sp. SL161]MCY1647999.1 hypothetical protein [Caulobacter sp. SL161]
MRSAIQGAKSVNRAAHLLSAGLAVLLGGGAAHAQDLREIQARNAVAHALEDARRDVLQSQIAASSALERAQTQVTLRDLNAALTTGPVVLKDIAPPPVTGDATLSDAEFNASMERLERLTQAALEEGNARMRAIRPASEPKE